MRSRSIALTAVALAGMVSASLLLAPVGPASAGTWTPPMPSLDGSPLTAAGSGPSRPDPPDGTTVTHHEVNTFEFTLPCTNRGNPYTVTTTSDVTVTIQKTTQAAGPYRKIVVLGLIDTGTYVATSPHGPRLTGWFVDSYTATARNPHFDGSGTVAPADGYDQQRSLVLTRGESILARDNITIHAAPYDAATSPTSPSVACR